MSSMSASRVSTTESEPPPPTSVFRPAPPPKTLSLESPVIESSNSDPVTFSKPLIEVNPLAVPRARLTVMPLAYAE